MAEVFFSYHEASAGKLVQQIADALENAGISCWYAKRNLPTGADFSAYIPQAIRACKVFLLILNKESNQSEHVKNELNLAFRRINKHEYITLVTFKVDNCVISDSVDYFINRFQITNAYPPNNQRIQSLIQQITRILNRATPLIQPSVNIVQHGKCGDSATYTLDNHGILTISGVGAIRKRITISDRANMVFRDLSNVKAVTILNGIESIGAWAFYECNQLLTVNISNSVTSIESHAFNSCNKLVGVYIPDSVASIGEYAFNSCDSLIKVSVPIWTEAPRSAFPEKTTVIRRFSF